MSESRKASRRGRRSPIRNTSTRPGAGGRGDRICSAPDVAGFLREDCHALRDSLQLEMVVAQYELRMRDVRSPQGVPVGAAVSAGVIAELERFGDALSHAILRGLAHIAIGDTARRAGDAAARLAEHGTGLPAAFGDVGAARPAGAWRTTASDGPEFAFFADFEHPLGAAHSIALFVEPRHGGVVKHIGLMHPMRDLEAPDAFHPSVLESLDVATASRLLREVLDRSYRPLLDLVDDYRVLIAAARTRTMEAAALAMSMSG